MGNGAALMLKPGGVLRYDFPALPVGPSAVAPFAQGDASGDCWAPGVLVLPQVVPVWVHWRAPLGCRPVELDGLPVDLEVDGEGRALACSFRVVNPGAGSGPCSLYLSVPEVKA